jgi:uncharacterized protein (TIGR03067 family)
MKTNMVVCGTVGLLAIAVLASAAPSASHAEIEKRLAGTWLGVSGHWGKENPPPESRSFTFTTNHQFKATIGKETIAGTYRIATTNEPFQIDFTFEFKGESVTTLTIFDFPNKDHLRIAEWDPDWRRKEIDPGITFKKKEPSNK